MTTEEKNEALDILFTENNADQNKNQNYKDNFQEFDLPEKYYLLEMYNKQKELQQFLANKGKTEAFPGIVTDVTQSNVQLAIYHLFCMQIEFQELKVELQKLAEQNQESELNTIDARYELIDMFFFMFNVGIYTGLDIMAVVNKIEEYVKTFINVPIEQWSDVKYINNSIENLMNYIDKLPWKAWKDYDLTNYNFTSPNIIEYYSLALYNMVIYAKFAFKETNKSLFDLYMNKWIENKRRQEDINSGYVLTDNIENVSQEDNNQ